MEFFEDRYSEHRLVQNDTFGATIIWSAVTEYFDTRKLEQGIPLPLSMLILPLCYHAQTAQAISSCSLKSGIYMALAKDRTIPAGLQFRMQDMADQTFSAIRVGSNAGLMTIDTGDNLVNIVPKLRTKPKAIRFNLENTKRIQRSATRLGRWFGEMPPATICSLLRVSF